MCFFVEFLKMSENLQSKSFNEKGRMRVHFKNKTEDFGKGKRENFKMRKQCFPNGRWFNSLTH